MELRVEQHLLEARRDAERLLLRAERPVTVRVGTVVTAALGLFLAALGIGFAMRAHDIAAVGRGDPLADLLARQQARLYWQFGAEPVTVASPVRVDAALAVRADE